MISWSEDHCQTKQSKKSKRIRDLYDPAPFVGRVLVCLVTEDTKRTNKKYVAM